jgi:hypothetical protein
LVWILGECERCAQFVLRQPLHADEESALAPRAITPPRR